MVEGVLNTKIKFFEVNTHGRILNRFSRDIQSLDNIVFTFLDTIEVMISSLFCSSTMLNVSSQCAS